MTNDPPGQSDWRTLFSIGRWALGEASRVNSRLTGGLFLVSVVIAIAPAGIALFARELINAFVDAASEGTAGFPAVVPWLWLGFGFTLAEGVAPLVQQFLIRRLYDEINLDVSSRILNHAATLDLSFFEDPTHRELIERAQQGSAEHLSSFVTHLCQMLTCMVQGISLIAILAYIEPLVLVVVAPGGLAYLRFKWRLSRQIYARQHARTPTQRWTTYFISRLTNWQSVGETKLLGLADVLIERFDKLMAEFRDEDQLLHRRGLAGALGFATLTTAAFFLVFAWLLYKGLKGGATIGDIAIFGATTARLRVTIETVITSIGQTRQHTLHISHLNAFLNTSSPASNSGIIPSSTRGEIKLENVTFTYPGADHPTLHDVSLHIQPGEIVGVVGETGAGKTTLVKLICRLYDPDAGRVTLDGTDIRELSPQYYYSQIGFLMQGFGCYEATAFENIAYGDWQRLGSDRETVQDVARRAKVDDFIAAMPEGYDTMLGRMFGSVDLSRGQWQRLALARAFSRNASVMILDEPTSNLDARSEYRLYSQFRELARGRATFLISHRFSALRMADRILVMEDGRLVEEGTHSELLDRSGTYAGLYGLHLKQMDI